MTRNWTGHDPAEAARIGCRSAVSLSTGSLCTGPGTGVNDRGGRGTSPLPFSAAGRKIAFMSSVRMYVDHRILGGELASGGLPTAVAGPPFSGAVT